jgi:hypothetical protein
MVAKYCHSQFKLISLSVYRNSEPDNRPKLLCRESSDAVVGRKRMPGQSKHTAIRATPDVNHL